MYHIFILPYPYLVNYSLFLPLLVSKCPMNLNYLLLSSTRPRWQTHRRRNTFFLLRPKKIEINQQHNYLLQPPFIYLFVCLQKNTIPAIRRNVSSPPQKLMITRKLASVVLRISKQIKIRLHARNPPKCLLTLALYHRWLLS